MRVVLVVAVLIAIMFAVGWAVTSTYAFVQRRRAKFAHDPMWYGMSSKERRAYAAELRERERQQYELERQQDLIDQIRAEATPKGSFL